VGCDRSGSVGGGVDLNNRAGSASPEGSYDPLTLCCRSTYHHLEQEDHGIKLKLNSRALAAIVVLAVLTLTVGCGF
jgi:hypothetical protein